MPKWSLWNVERYMRECLREANPTLFLRLKANPKWETLAVNLRQLLNFRDCKQSEVQWLNAAYYYTSLFAPESVLDELDFNVYLKNFFRHIEPLIYERATLIKRCILSETIEIPYVPILIIKILDAGDYGALHDAMIDNDITDPKLLEHCQQERHWPGCFLARSLRHEHME